MHSHTDYPKSPSKNPSRHLGRFSPNPISIKLFPSSLRKDLYVRTKLFSNCVTDWREKRKLFLLFPERNQSVTIFARGESLHATKNTCSAMRAAPVMIFEGTVLMEIWQHTKTRENMLKINTPIAAGGLRKTFHFYSGLMSWLNFSLWQSRNREPEVGNFGSGIHYWQSEKSFFGVGSDET